MHDELLQLKGQYAEMVALQKANPIDSVSFETESFCCSAVNRIFIVFQGSSWCIKPPSLLQCVGNR